MVKVYKYEKMVWQADGILSRHQQVSNALNVLNWRNVCIPSLCCVQYVKICAKKKVFTANKHIFLLERSKLNLFFLYRIVVRDEKRCTYFDYSRQKRKIFLRMVSTKWSKVRKIRKCLWNVIWSAAVFNILATLSWKIVYSARYNYR